MEDRIRKFQKKKAGANDGLYTFEIVTGALGILKDGSSHRVRKGFKRENKVWKFRNMMGARGGTGPKVRLGQEHFFQSCLESCQKLVFSNLAVLDPSMVISTLFFSILYPSLSD